VATVVATHISSLRQTEFLVRSVIFVSSRRALLAT